ncbi:MAG TPA: protease pro-enzyme activation domain-containing protein [Candidatus Aquilonibacter sp.]|nr:protease pro-enzyme activation domain-containing protein [Candidatus Aquilonibacter sp.]
MRTLRGDVPPVVAHLSPNGTLPGTTQLHLAIGLPLHNRAELTELLQQLYDPASPNYHKFLTPAEFTARFGPTEADYAAVKDFARAHGFAVTGTYDNRLLLDVTGSAAAANSAFHVTLRTYWHPTEDRNFFAPDTEPTVESNLPIADVCGLENYTRPYPKFCRRAGTFSPRAGSAPGGEYMGNDFRNAYVPGTTLDGSGQMVGLVQFDGYYTNDIVAYENLAGRTNIPLQRVLLDGFSGTPTTGSSSGNPEVSLDIEMAMSMAPALARIVVFEGNPNNFIPNDVLNAMAASNTVKNLSCSWGWNGGPTTTTDNIFLMMAADGQSFFDAAGDSDAFTPGASSVNGVDNPNTFNTPSSSPYITQVGGTTLTMNGSGASYSSETVWNWGYDSSAGGYVGSSGGVSSYYSIPVWQQGVNSFLANGGSTMMRNIPDVALTADNVYVAYDNGSSGDFGGTSCAAPLWAGFMALVNQQAAAGGQTNGFGLINPAIYEIANESIYNSAFNDVTTGNNTWPSSPNAFYAVPGYDLCTGLGTPAGTNLINALVNPDPLIVVSNHGFNAVGLASGTFSIASQIFYLTNAGASSLTWSLVNTSSWLNVSSSGSPLAAGASGSVVASLNTVASNLPPGIYTANLGFSNVTSGVTHYRFFTLTVNDALVILPTNNFSFVGPPGGSFSPVSQGIILTNAGSSVLNWGINDTSSWFNVSLANGSLAAGAQTTVSITPAAAMTNLPDGTYGAVLLVTNLSSQFVQTITFSVFISQSLVENGGFETGDFTGWTLNANDGGSPYNFVASASTGISITPHSGNYFAALGEVGTPLAYLLQTLPTIAGQKYLLSLWLDNPAAGSHSAPNEFSVSWNGSTLYDKKNIGQLNWTNMQFVVTSTGGSTVLQIGGRDDDYYLGLDDVGITPVFAPTISMQPTNQTVFAGGNAAFTVMAGGSTPLVYHWRKNGNNIGNGGNISGATTNVLQFSAVTTNNSGNYTVVITNAYGAITSAVVTLTVNLQNPTVALTSSENPSGYLDSLNFTATVAPATATGGVQFFTNGIFFDSESLSAGSAASVFTPTLPRGTNLITAIYSGDANDLPATNTLAQVVTNHPPTATPFFTNRIAGFSLKIPVASLASDWSDVDGDTVSLAAIGVSTNGVTVTDNAGTLIYCNSNNVNDEFTCTITDGWGGTNFQNVFITVVPLPENAIPAITSLASSGGSTISLNLAGANGFTYVLETTTNLAVPDSWGPVATNVVGPSGVWQFNDVITNNPQQFYRLELVQ